MSDQYFLALYPKVEGSLAIRSLPRSVRDIFLQIRMESVVQQTPGVIEMPWPALCECLGIRSEKRQEQILNLLESRNLIDGFIGQLDQ